MRPRPALVHARFRASALAVIALAAPGLIVACPSVARAQAAAPEIAPPQVAAPPSIAPHASGELSGEVAAPPPPPKPPAMAEAPSALSAPHERRAGLVIGFGYGAGVAGSSGYPNGASLIDDPRYYSASDLMSGTGWSFYVMGALTDYLSFGAWFGAQTYESSHWRSVGGGGGFRVEAFPLYRLVPALADLAVFAQLGLGTTALHNKLPGNYPSADGEQSFLGIGVLHEWSLFKVLGGHVAVAPTLEYDLITARAVERHNALLGVRMAFYGGI
jgi:hypothetical protein